MRNLFRSRVSSACNVLCRTVVFSFSLLTVTLPVTPLLAEECNVIKPSKEEVIQEIQGLQAPFIANNGQVDEGVCFYAKTFGGMVFVTKDGAIVYSLPEAGLGSEGAEGQVVEFGIRSAEHRTQEEGADKQCLAMPPNNNLSALPADYNPYSEMQNQQSSIRGVALKEQLVGGKSCEIKGRVQSVTTVSYFKGSDPSKWQSSISTYNVVDMGEVYEGIGLSLKAYGNNVEKLFTVRPDASYETISIRLDGAKGLMVNEAGELVVETELGHVKFTKPVAYQEIDGKRVGVAVEYSVHKPGFDVTESLGTGELGSRRSLETQNPKLEIRNLKPTYGFTVASYDKTKDLVIDPLLASTYLGGVYEDYGRSIAIDAGGNVYVTGETLSSDLPMTPGAYHTSRKGHTDVYVSKFNSGLTSLLASTFLGGATSHDYSKSIAVDAAGNVFVTGTTYSTDFPATRGTYRAVNKGGWDVFVSKLNGDLTNLIASTCLGGKSDECGYSIAVDAGGNIYVAGETLSPEFPTTPGAYDTAYNGGYYDAFVLKFNGDLTSLLASTFLGGGASDYGRAMVIDAGGNVFVTGNTCSRNFPTASGVYSTVHNGGTDDAFVSKFNSGLTSLMASTFLGGQSGDFGKSIAVDGGGNVYVTGETVSPNFPTTPDAYDISHARCSSKDAFVSKFSSGLTSLSASTLLGGIGSESSRSIAVDAGGNIYVAGVTSSPDFPTTLGAYNVSPNGDGDAFVSKLNGGLTSLLASTYHGGHRSDNGNAIAIDGGGNIYVTGETLSSNFPTTPGAYDTAYHRSEDVFVSRFNADLSADIVSK